MRLAADRVRATREAVGPDVDIPIEGHGRLSPNMAIRMARLFEELDPFFFEEPVPPENVDEMAKVAAAIPSRDPAAAPRPQLGATNHQTVRPTGSRCSTTASPISESWAGSEPKTSATPSRKP